MINDPKDMPLESLETDIFTTLNIAEAERLLGGTNTHYDSGGSNDPDKDC